MNFLKKNYKIFVFFFVIIVFIIGFCIIMFHKPQGKCDIITVKNNYYVINSDLNNYLNIPLYFSLENPAFMEINNIEKTYLSTENNDEIIPLSIKEINYLNKIKQKKESYYLYDLKVMIDLTIDTLTIYDNIYLCIEYKSGAKMKLLIGDLSIYNYIQNNDLHYISLKGIVKEHGNKKMLQCVAIKLNTIDEIEIVDIIALNNDVYVNMEDSVVIDSLDADNLEIDDFVNNDYNIIGNNLSKKSIKISDQDYLLMYLKYDKYIEMTCCGFIIKYLRNGVLYEKVVTPFMYYNTNNLDEELVTVTYDANNY